MVTVRLPAALTGTGRSGAVELPASAYATLRAALDELEVQLPGTIGKLVNGDGRLYGYVNIYVDGDDVRRGAGLDTPVGEGSEILVLPAISGG
jgi:molybdopterin synthase sulfur carrier subunit